MEAGGFARGQFSAARWKLVRREQWRIAAIVALTVGTVLFGGATGGVARLIAAMMVGFSSGVLLVLWMVGDLRAVTWLWGAVGEERTEDALKQLDRSRWSIEHDIRRPGRGNWDHIVTSRAGTFMLESKNYSRVAKVEGDALVSGLNRYEGVWLRASAAELKRTRGARWVHAVVVVWGEFPQRIVVSDRVVYLAGDELVPWLESRAAAVRTHS